MDGDSGKGLILIFLASWLWNVHDDNYSCADRCLVLFGCKLTFLPIGHRNLTYISTSARCNVA